MIALWLMLACGTAETPAATPPPVVEVAKFGDTRLTQLKRYQVEVWFNPAVPPMGELFEVTTTVRGRDGGVIEDAKVKVDARMPAHGHGMQTAPVADPGVCDAAGACKHPGGVYVTKGFAFHMGGEWTITVDIEGSEGPDSTSFIYNQAG